MLLEKFLNKYVYNWEDKHSDECDDDDDDNDCDDKRKHLVWV